MLRTVARGINELCGPLTPLEDLLHAWSVAMQESLQLAHALLHPCERSLVEVYAVLIAPELACCILDVDERTLERVSSSLQTPVEDGGLAQLPDKPRDRVDHTIVPAQRLMNARSRAQERLGVLRRGQGILKLLVLALLRCDLVDAREDKRCLVNLRVCRLAHLAPLPELGLGTARLREGFLVGVTGRADLSLRPGIEELDVGLFPHEPLVLVLTTEIDGGAHPFGQLPHRCDATVDAHAAATVGSHAATHDGPIRVPSLEIHPSLDEEPLRALTHGTCVCPLPHEELNGREERRLTGTGLARKHREAICGLKRRLMDKGDVMYGKFVDHVRLSP